MHALKRFTTLAGLLLALLPAAARHSSAGDAADVRLPALDMLRSVSNTGDAEQDGSAAWMTGGNAAANGTEMEYGTVNGTVAGWSIHCFDLADPFSKATVNLTAALGGVYIAVADFQTGRWDFSGPFAGNRQLELDNTANRSGAGNLFIAVLATRDNSSLQSISVDGGGSGGEGYFDASLGIDMGEFVDLSVVNGRPAVACYDSTNQKLMYIRANDATGSSWDSAVYPDPATSCGLNPSLAVINGRPAIAYESFENGTLDLKYVRAADDDGTSWGSPQGIVFATSFGYFPQLREVDGSPAVGFTHDLVVPGSLKFLRANDSTGSSWGFPVNVASGAAFAQIDMEIVNGNPALCWTSSDAESVHYLRSSDAQGSSWGSPLTIEGSLAGSYEASLAIVDGKPAACYTAEEVGELRYCRANDANGAAWGSPLLVDSGAETGAYCSLVYAEGLPQVSYFHGDDVNELKFVRASDSSGSAWGTPQVLDADAGLGTSMADVNGVAALAYFSLGQGLIGWLYGVPTS